MRADLPGSHLPVPGGRSSIWCSLAATRASGPTRTPPTSPQTTRESTWRVCDTAAYELLEYPPDDATPEQAASIAESGRRVALCFAQQMLSADTAELPRWARRTTDVLLADHPSRHDVK